VRLQLFAEEPMTGAVIAGTKLLSSTGGESPTAALPLKRLNLEGWADAGAGCSASLMKRLGGCWKGLVPDAVCPKPSLALYALELGVRW
jgi:hypothetical protein